MKKTKKILLVDDDEIFVYLIKKTISDVTPTDQIKVFGNGQDAIDFLKKVAEDKQSLPDIIFLDLTMPVLDGWGFLEEYVLLKPKFGKKITLYILSSSVSPSDILRAKKITSVSDFIIKPVSKEKFIEAITKL